MNGISLCQPRRIKAILKAYLQTEIRLDEFTNKDDTRHTDNYKSTINSTKYYADKLLTPSMLVLTFFSTQFEVQQNRLNPKLLNKIWLY